jgi:hypothetical protein
LEVFREGILMAEYDLLEDTPIPVASLEGAKDHSSLSATPLLKPHHPSYWIVGKDPAKCDIVAEHMTVSKQHCVVQCGWNPANTASASSSQPVFVHLYDLQSSNGTYVLGHGGAAAVSPAATTDAKTAFLASVDAKRPGSNSSGEGGPRMDWRRIPPLTYCPLYPGDQFKVAHSTRIYCVKYHSLTFSRTSKPPVVEEESGEAGSRRLREKRKRRHSPRGEGGDTSSDDSEHQNKPGVVEEAIVLPLAKSKEDSSSGEEEENKPSSGGSNQVLVSFDAYLDQQQRNIDFVERRGGQGGGFDDPFDDFFDRTKQQHDRSRGASGQSYAGLQAKRANIVKAIEQLNNQEPATAASQVHERKQRLQDLQRELVTVDANIQQYLDLHTSSGSTAVAGNRLKTTTVTVKVLEIPVSKTTDAEVEGD